MSAEKKTVLIVDDEQDTVTYFQSLLEDNGYDVVVAMDGEEGLARVREAVPDLVTLDVTMPNMSGTRFYRTMKEDENLKRVPILIVTGISRDYEKFISTRRQVPPPEGYLTKPIDQGEFLAMVRRLIGA